MTRQLSAKVEAAAVRANLAQVVVEGKDLHGDLLAVAISQVRTDPGCSSAQRRGVR